MNNNTGYFILPGAGGTDRELAAPAAIPITAFVELHVSTSPEAIHEQHEYEIRQARRIHRSPEAIAEALCLPLSIVQKHLIELGALNGDDIFRWWRPDRSQSRPRTARRHRRGSPSPAHV